jgi:hypothetical protein
MSSLFLLSQKTHRPHRVGLHSPQPAGESRVRHANRCARGAHPALRIHVRTRTGYGAFRLLHHSRGLLVNVKNNNVSKPPGI